MADMTPPADADSFIAAHGWAGEIVPLTGDASFRRYFRVMSDGRTAILMDAPPSREKPGQFVAIGGWLADKGFAAPAIYGADVDSGLVLLEDFGEARMREAIDERPEDASGLYAAATDLLVALAKHPAGDLEPYDRAFLNREVDLLVEWYAPAVGLSVDAAAWRTAWDTVFDHALAAEPVTVLRDYHAENLMLVGEGRTLGLLDFQDAVAGHPAYDLVSLLQDARRDVEPAIEQAMLARYREATGAGEDFLRAYHVLGAQRSTKIVGLFTRLWQRDGKARYPAMLPRVWRYLERDLAEPVMAPVADWFDANIPADKRGDPMVIGPMVIGA